MATLLGSLLVSLGLESGEFKSGLTDAEKALKASQKRIEKVGQGMADMGQKLSLAVTVPLVALGTKAVQGFVAQEQAMADVNAALASMGQASGKTSAELLKTADALEMRSLFDAEVILKQVTANLLTFGNVAGREFDRAQQAAVDMATRMGGEPQAAAIMLGKALNDPVKGITALTRVGVQFTEQQKAQIKAMSAAGDMAGAQGVILAEVERQFKGAASAAADATPWRKVQVAIGQAMDAIGAAILPIIGPVTDAIVMIAGAFASLPEPMQKAIVVAGVFAAALGPLLAVFGPIVSAAAPFLAVIKAIAASGGVFVALKSAVIGLGVAFGPMLAIGAAVAAAGVLIYKNWDSIAPVLSELWQTIQTTLGPPLQALVQAVSQLLSALWNGPLGQEVREAATNFAKLGMILLEALGPALLVAIKAAIIVIGEIVKQIADGVRLVSALLTGDWRAAFDAARAIVNRAFFGLPEFVINQVRKLVTGVQTWVGSKLNAIWDGVVKKVEAVKRSFFNLYDAVVGNSYIPDMVDGIASEMSRLDSVMVDKAAVATQKTADRFRDLAGQVRSIMDRLFPDAANARALAGDRQMVEEAVKAGVIARGVGDQIQTALNYESTGNPYDTSKLETEAMMADTLERALRGVDIAAGKVADSMATVGEKVVNLKDLGAQAFGDLSRGLADVITGARSLGDVLRGVISNLANSALNSLFSSLGASMGIPAFASGTNFAPGGLSLVGERGPELVNLPRGSQVIPNNDLKGMGGDSYAFNINVSGAMSAEDARRTGNQIASSASKRMAMARRAGMAG